MTCTHSYTILVKRLSFLVEIASLIWRRITKWLPFALYFKPYPTYCFSSYSRPRKRIHVGPNWIQKFHCTINCNLEWSLLWLLEVKMQGSVPCWVSWGGGSLQKKLRRIGLCCWPSPRRILVCPKRFSSVLNVSWTLKINPSFWQ